MKTQYRIAKTHNGCFPQVRRKRFIFWGPWMKIAKHSSGFGLYDSSDHGYPKTQSEARELIKAYDAWNLREIDDKVVYIAVPKPFRMHQPVVINNLLGPCFLAYFAYYDHENTANAFVMFMKYLETEPTENELRFRKYDVLNVPLKTIGEYKGEVTPLKAPAPPLF